MTRPINLKEICFPVFKLGSIKPQTEEGIVFYLSRLIDDGTDVTSIKIVDDTSIEKPTLGLRRLELYKQGIPLKRIPYAIFFLGDFIKLATSTTWFIDNNGRVFNYKKSRFVKLVFKKIKNIHNILSGGSIIEVEGIPSRFKTLYSPTSRVKYAGVLMDGISSNILYGLYIDKPKDTKRKI